MKSVSLLGIAITTNPKAELLQQIQEDLEKKSQKSLTIVTPNPEQVVYAQKDVHFKELLNQADINLPDGTGILWASRILKSNIKERIPGIEFMEELVKLAAEKGYRIGLIGGRNGVAEKALEKLQQKYPGLVGWTQNGPEVKITNYELRIVNYEEKDYFQMLVTKIKESRTRFIFIGLGAPKQEYFIENLKSYLLNFKSSLVIMSVGGAYDELSGRIPRAPQFINNLGFKWLWRLSLEPARIFRQIKLFIFIGLVLQEKFSFI